MGLDSIVSGVSDPKVDSAVKSLQLVWGFDVDTIDMLVELGKKLIEELERTCAPGYTPPHFNDYLIEIYEDIKKELKSEDGIPLNWTLFPTVYPVAIIYNLYEKDREFREWVDNVRKSEKIEENAREVFEKALTEYGPIARDLITTFFGVKNLEEVPLYKKFVKLIKDKSFYWLNVFVTDRFMDILRENGLDEDYCKAAYEVVCRAAMNPVEAADLIGLGWRAYYGYLEETDRTLYAITDLDSDWSNLMEEFVHTHVKKRVEECVNILEKYSEKVKVEA